MLHQIWFRIWSLLGRVSLLTKIMGIVLLVVLILDLTVVWNIKANVASSLREQLQERGVATATGLAAPAAEYILTENLLELYLIAQNALRADKDIGYVYIRDAKGRVRAIAHTFEGGFPVNLLTINQLEGDAPQTVILDTEEGQIVDIAFPIMEGTAGSVHVGLSARRIDTTVITNIKFIFLATSLALVPGLSLAYLLAWVVTTALRGVVRATEALGRGDFDKKAPVWAADEIGHLGAAFNQMAERLKSSQEQLLQRQRGLLVLNETARATSRSLTLDDVLNSALTSVSELMKVETGLACVFGREGEIVSFTFVNGGSPVLVRKSVSIGICPCPRAEELATQPYLKALPLSYCPVIEETMALPAKGGFGVCLPFKAKEGLLGVLHLTRLGSLFTGEDIQVLQGVVEQLAVAVENTRLWETLKEKEEVKSHLLEKLIVAQEEERQRVSRDLHDEIGQRFTSLLVELRALEMTPNREPLNTKVSNLRALAADSLHSIQNIIMELRPSVLDDMGLEPALRRYIQEYAKRHVLKVDLETSGLQRERFYPRVETTIYRIVQEALTNVARHAEARSVSVLLTHRDQTLVAVVEDDGKGFNVAEAMKRPETSLGIRGMHERASLIGARFTVDSKPGAGTSVFLEVDLPGAFTGHGSND